VNKTRTTWIGLLVTLSALTIPGQTIASESNSVCGSEALRASADRHSQAIETRLDRIVKTLKERENQLSPSSPAREIIDNLQNTKIARGWLKGGGGGFVNRAGGGGFVNRRWPDGGGFLNRRY
jgi:rSAM-associated Gly-rich repeat protein